MKKAFFEFYSMVYSPLLSLPKQWAFQNKDISIIPWSEQKCHCDNSQERQDPVWKKWKNGQKQIALSRRTIANLLHQHDQKFRK